MQKFRKKPVEIEAWRIGSMTAQPDWLHEAHNRGILFGNGDDYFEIVTLEGKMRGNRGDWIIRGVKGELYPCKPDIFDMTYEVIGNEQA